MFLGQLDMKSLRQSLILTRYPKLANIHGANTPLVSTASRLFPGINIFDNNMAIHYSLEEHMSQLNKTQH